MTFAQLRIRLTTHFSEHVPVIKWHISVLTSKPGRQQTDQFSPCKRDQAYYTPALYSIVSQQCSSQKDGLPYSSVTSIISHNSLDGIRLSPWNCNCYWVIAPSPG